MSYQPPKNVISSRNDLAEIINSVREYRRWAIPRFGLVHEMYRGQGRSSWKLQPNIARTFTDAENLMEVEIQITGEFNRRMLEAGVSKAIETGFLNKKFHTEWLLIQQAQHYGIPTRFMDWTNDWEVALFFAVENPADDEFDGQFWIYLIPPGGLTIDNSNPTYLDIDPYKFDQTIFLNSAGFLSESYIDKLAERRKGRQRGKFCIQSHEMALIPLEEQELHIPNLSKILIPKELKKVIREELAAENITNETLYIEQNPEINEIVKILRQEFRL